MDATRSWRGSWGWRARRRRPRRWALGRLRRRRRAACVQDSARCTSAPARYLGLAPVPGGLTNVCLVVPYAPRAARRARAVGRAILRRRRGRSLLAPRFAERAAGHRARRARDRWRVDVRCPRAPGRAAGGRRRRLHRPDDRRRPAPGARRRPAGRRRGRRRARGARSSRASAIAGPGAAAAGGVCRRNGGSTGSLRAMVGLEPRACARPRWRRAPGRGRSKPSSLRRRRAGRLRSSRRCRRPRSIAIGTLAAVIAVMAGEAVLSAHNAALLRAPRRRRAARRPLPRDAVGLSPRLHRHGRRGRAARTGAPQAARRGTGGVRARQGAQGLGHRVARHALVVSRARAAWRTADRRAAPIA